MNMHHIAHFKHLTAGHKTSVSFSEKSILSVCAPEASSLHITVRVNGKYNHSNISQGGVVQ